MIWYFAGIGASYDAEEYYRSAVPLDVSITVPIMPIKAPCPMDHETFDDTGVDISDREVDVISTTSLKEEAI